MTNATLNEMLNELARLRGLGEAYYDHRGELRYFSQAARRAILQAMGVNVDDEVAMRAALLAPSPVVGEGRGEGSLSCYQPPSLTNRKCWGLSVQLYTLRSNRNWGMGDFGDLRELIELTVSLGCDLIGLNPLHALFPAAPDQCSPYSPSSRLFNNVLYIAVDDVAEFAVSDAMQSLWRNAAFQSALQAVRATPNVMYEQVSALKLSSLRLLYQTFVDKELTHNTPRAAAFKNFVQERGDALLLHATFDALDKYFRHGESPLIGWSQWPTEYRDPHSETVRAFKHEHADEIEFFMYLQWLADEQLTHLQQLARDKDMRIGLYGDLAVGANPDGSEVWSNQSLYVKGVGVGAPPDPLALNGQDWGIPPIDPHALRAQRLQPFVQLLQANMRHAGALRIDHVMSLFRLWWVPNGFSAADGVYVHYPLDALVKVLAQESQHAQCLIIGEDLGTVPDEMRHAMAEYQLHHYKVLLFEKNGDGSYRAPHDYVRNAIATVTTHDLPPLKAWWQSDDIQLRESLALYPHADTAHHLRAEREADRRAMMNALHAKNLWQWQSQDPLPEYSLSLSRAVHLYLSLSNSASMLVQLEDLIGMTDPVNVPGTHTEHANWQRKLVTTTKEMLAAKEIQEMLHALTKARTGTDPNG